MQDNRLDYLGLRNLGTVHWNLSTPALYEEAVRNTEGWVSHLGPFVVHTGHHTGRSPNDKFIVKEPSSENRVAWGKVNRPMDAAKFDSLHAKLGAYLQNRNLYIQDLYACADPHYQLPVRLITHYAWHSLFGRNLLIQPAGPVTHSPEKVFTVIDVPRFHSDPSSDGTNSDVFIVINFSKRLVIIGGTSYAGEIKKSVFTLLNYLLPGQGVMPMHCSANVGRDGDTTLFFGLSGTGKTTLSADPERSLIGDDEHGWSNAGVFNFEGGCYAKVVRLSKSAEPDIYETTRMFGTVLENVVMDSQSRHIDLDDISLTENTRAAYPLTHIRNIVPSGTAGHPKNVIMLTCDASGVLPPISKLTPHQAMYHFLSGYTAKVAGRRRASRSLRRPSVHVSARPSCRWPRQCMQKCWERGSANTKYTHGSSIRGGVEGRMAWVADEDCVYTGDDSCCPVRFSRCNSGGGRPRVWIAHSLLMSGCAGRCAEPQEHLGEQSCL